MSDDDVHGWLLDGDPAVRWRVLRDLTGAPADVVARERARVAEEGWGGRLLAAQNPDGGWATGDYSPKWTSTTYTLLRLLWLGLPPGHPAVQRGLDRLRAWAARWKAPETCIVSMLVRLTCDLGPAARAASSDVAAMVGHLLAVRQADGGWNCAAGGDAGRHGSFHTSIQALEALASYRAAGGALPVTAAARGGEDFFLAHRLYRSHRTGEVAVRGSTRLRVFPEWHFDVLRGLEHFAATGRRDDRLADAVDVVRTARHRDGRWRAAAPYPGRQWFVPDPEDAARWVTVRALAVLRWWAADGVSQGAGSRG